MKYQDTWINGERTDNGYRDCEKRYDIIKSFCNSLPAKFTVCDIGANMAYFDIRLIEDFGCYCAAFEFDQYEKRKKIIPAYKTLMYINRKISLSDLCIMNKSSHYDLVLALSVLHHVPGSVTEWIRQLRQLGDNLIVEFALSDSKRTSTRKEYQIPEDGTLLGYGNSHLKDKFLRPIILYNPS